ncbi:MAG: protein-L-isoaspartate O-methyltransferase family protein [Phycicoccus sp.]
MTGSARERVAAALAAQPRDRYLPEGQRARAGHDGPLPIGYGQTNSQPRTVVTMLELLEVSTGDHVLDVGAGSGWTTALLAELTGPAGSVLGVERVPELVEPAARRLADAGLRWATVRLATRGVLGAPDGGAFDRILVSATATTLPTALVSQLVPDGILVVPVQGVMTRAVNAGQQLAVTEHGPYRFVPLIGG